MQKLARQESQLAGHVSGFQRVANQWMCVCVYVSVTAKFIIIEKFFFALGQPRRPVDSVMSRERFPRARMKSREAEMRNCEFPNQNANHC